MPNRWAEAFVKTPARISIAYALTGAAWILWSDQVVGWFGTDPETLTRLQTYKGWGYVAVTALILYGVLCRREVEIKRSAQSMRESEERLKRAQEIAHLGSWELDVGNNRLTWSDEVYRIFGLEPQAFGATYEAFLDAVHPDDRAAVDAAYFGSLRENHDAYEIEHRVVRRGSGEVRFVHEKCEHVRDPSGRIVRSVGMVHDITERKRAEEALRESELFYRQALESIPGMVFTTRPDGYCDYQSQQWGDFTGAPMEERLGDGWNRLLHPQDQPVASAAWRAAVEERALYDLECRIRRSDGAYEWFKVRGRPILNEAGQIVRWFGTALNIDNLVRAQDALLDAKEAAEAGNRAKSDFLARMSHEIRTPMNGVLGMTELALMEELPFKAREYLGFAKQSAKSLLDIINDILDLSKVEAGKAELRAEDFDLREAFSSVLSTLAAQASRKGLSLQHRVAPNVPQLVRGDRGRLGQVLVNLVGNAIKFTEAGSVTVAVEVAEREGSSSAGSVHLVCAVQDTGIGIPSDALGIIFEAFSPAGASHHARYGGTGLGLAISRQLVRLMGGRIWAESEPGRGSTFRFTVELGVPEASVATPCAAAAGVSKARPRGLRILLAEDNAVNQFLGRELLERDGHTVVVAETGRKALDALAREPFDLVLMDVRMPDMDGLEATRRIREGAVPGVPRDLPIIALTAHALRGDRERFLSEGMDAYISKPIDLEEVYRVLAEISARKT